MRRRKSSIPMGSFNPSYHYEMLIDQRRVKPFEEAIRSAISSSDVVLDIGTGSGILAILAARAGAKKVYAIERMADMRQIAESNFAREQLPALNYDIISEDATKELNLCEPIDLVICELLSTWLVTEQQASVCINLQRYLKASAKMIPARMNNFITAVHAPLRYFDTTIDAPYYIRELRNSQAIKLSNTVRSHTTDFMTLESHNVNVTNIELICHADGIINAVLLESNAVLNDKYLVDDGQTLFLPYIVPLKRSIHVSDGERLKASIEYNYGLGWNQLVISLNTEK
ncbi:50S ribosomal protein L11 methyltransferase [Candidatus Spongiihabitans sp.]|uniref:50S ribosomal protein L11 methyltransferase n=1 Tax=Candidatus Spongiihabitans sp. TaxID=3101308 RepID=UPI003C6FCDCD